MTELLTGLIRLQGSVCAAILLVMLLRPLARRWFGPSTTYRLWGLVPAVAAAAVLPGPFVAERAGTDWTGAAILAGAIAKPGPLLLAWLAGALGFTLWALVAHRRFLREARAGRAGPAVVGVFRPRIVVPAGHEDSFTEVERRLIRLHEQAHIDRGDMRMNLLILAGQALCWFNPLGHLAAGLAREDQELACDRTVLDRRPGERRLYAETLLKAAGAAAIPPLACAWSARHSLEVRLRLASAAGFRFDQRRHVAGSLAVLALSLASTMAVWLAQPAAGRRLPHPPPPQVTVYLDLRPGSVLPRG